PSCRWAWASSGRRSSLVSLVRASLRWRLSRRCEGVSTARLCVFRAGPVRAGRSLRPFARAGAGLASIQFFKGGSGDCACALASLSGPPARRRLRGCLSSIAACGPRRRLLLRGRGDVEGALQLGEGLEEAVGGGGAGVDQAVEAEAVLEGE